MITLIASKTKEPFFQDRITTIPQRQGETEALVIIGDAGETVLTPPIGSRTSMIVREKIPGIARGAIVFPHGSPLAL
jgi:hypothetical protein